MLYEVYEGDAWEYVMNYSQKTFGTDWIHFETLLEGLGGHNELRTLLYSSVPAIRVFNNLQSQLSSVAPTNVHK